MYIQYCPYSCDVYVHNKYCDTDVQVLVLDTQYYLHVGYECLLYVCYKHYDTGAQILGLDMQF